MPRPSRLFVSILLLWIATAVIGLAQAPQPAQAAPQPAAQTPPGQTAQSSGDPLDEPLTAEELVVPSNKGLEAVAPALPPPTGAAPNTTATAPAPNGPAGKAPAGGELQQRGKSGVFTLRAEVDEVVLHATVVDDRQRLVTNLDRNAFTVFENGQAQPITSFRHEDVPVAVGILVDDSASMRDKRPAVNQAALNFVRSSNPDDRVFVVNFSDPQNIYIDVNSTSSIPKLKEALENRDARGETALYDAVAASADHIMKQPNIDRRLEKKVLLVITDGWDKASVDSLEQAVRRVQVEGGPTIYTIGF